MPARGKRTAADFDPNKSDSEDETYGQSSAKPPRSRPSKSRTGKPSRKRQRRAYDGDDSSDDVGGTSLSDLSVIDSSESPEEEEQVEMGPSGRPRRKVVEKTKPIIEKDDSQEEISEIEDDEVFEATRPSPVKRVSDRMKSKWFKIKYEPGKSPILEADLPLRRSERTRSGSAPVSRPTSSGAPTGTMRRGSRRARGNADLVALTQQNPSEGSKRPTRGGKGPKKGVASSQPEADDVDSGPKDLQSTDELQKDHYQPRREIPASGESLEEEPEESDDRMIEDEPPQRTAGEVKDSAELLEIPESGDEVQVGNQDNQEDEDEEPINQPRRSARRHSSGVSAGSVDAGPSTRGKKTVLGKRKTRGSQRSGNQESSDFEPPAGEAEEEDLSDSEDSASPRKMSQAEGNDGSPLRRGAKRHRPNTRSRRVSNESDEQDELQEELEALHPGRRQRAHKNLDIIMEQRHHNRRRTKADVNYNIMNSNQNIAEYLEDIEAEPATQGTPSRKARGGATYGRSLFSTYGPFGGGGGPMPVLGGSTGLGAVGGADSDSSDDERMQRPKPGATSLGDAVGMTPTTANAGGFGGFPAPAGQLHGMDPVQGAAAGTPANFGKIKDKQALADADPLGVDQNVNFDGVGGLQGHIDQLKEMVALPLLYPEVFQRFHVTPPRGVLFHGPPGTGKTLLARALASSVSSQGKKVTFYMRKGADALSKWVGEAERQLRMLFEEARKTQPSIIFFDEIDGLAPVRSSKQEQIHASIVSTLLALMDGMDGRGQVIVIGATNRPDSVDPALRRPGRFDREFYFPLPNTEARRAILDIHTKGWEPPLKDDFKDEIARATKGFGGADLRALCTEAALNAVQRRYPQIYKSNEKLQIKPETIKIDAKDFMISIKRTVPSSQRSTTSAAAPLPSHIEPLLHDTLERIKHAVGEILPQSKPLTALQEAEFEDAENDHGMRAEQMQQEFERARIFRPRCLIRGDPGMGQQYLASALLHHFEGLHVQAFDLPTLLGESTRSSEAAIVQLFTEVRRHKPSVIYIPNVDVWYCTVGGTVISTLCGLLRTLAPTDPVMLLGVAECSEKDLDKDMIKDLFGFSKKCQFGVSRPSRSSRQGYYESIVNYIRTSPADYPNPADRKKRTLEILVPVPPEIPKPPPPPTKAELKALKKKDRLLLNQLKIRIQPVMDNIKLKYRKFRLPIIDEKEIRYLFDESDPGIVTSDLPRDQRQHEHRPYEKGTDEHGEPVLKMTDTAKFFYNLDTTTIEKRLSNGYYKRPKDFLSDIKKLTKDAKTFGDEERLLKANEMQANVEVDMNWMEVNDPQAIAELEHVYERELLREKAEVEKAKRQAEEEGRKLNNVTSNVPPREAASFTDASTGPVHLGQPLQNGLVQHPITPSNPSTVTKSLQEPISDLSDLNGHLHNSKDPSKSSRETIDFQINSSEERMAGYRASISNVSSFGPSAQTIPPESHTGLPMTLEQRKISNPASMTQEGLRTPMAPGSQPADYINDASTTSSENKRNPTSSGEKNSTQQSSGPPGPDLSIFAPAGAGSSQIADTVGNTQASQSQPSSGQPSSNPSDQTSLGSQGQLLSQHDGLTQMSPPQPRDGSKMSPPLPREGSRSSITSLLNNEPAPPRTGAASHPPLRIDDIFNDRLIQSMVARSALCSVEQLEQLYSAMMNELWKTRGEWDRRKVAMMVQKRFEDELSDMPDFEEAGAGNMEVEY